MSHGPVRMWMAKDFMLGRQPGVACPVNTIFVKSDPGLFGDGFGFLGTEMVQYIEIGYKCKDGSEDFAGSSEVKTRTKEGSLVWYNYIDTVCGNRTESSLVALSSWLTLDQSELEINLNLLDKVNSPTTFHLTSHLRSQIYSLMLNMQKEEIKTNLTPSLPPPARIMHMIRGGSALNIMYFHCFESLELDPALLQRYDGPIYGFNNQPIQVEGVLTLNVAFGSGRTYVTLSVRFLIVKMASSFNVVIGRPTLTEIRAVVSQSHICRKFPTPMGIATLRVDNRPEDETRATPVECVEEVQIDDRDPNRKTQIGTRLNPKDRAELIALLRANKDIGKNLEVYVDDIMVKSLKAEDHLADLGETFNNLKRNKMRLNPAKCIFSVESGKFLGFMVCQRGIEVNLKKIKAIAEMEPPKSVKDTHRLIKKVAAFHRFISKSVDKCLPFFKIMRSVAQKDESGKQKKFEWNQECQAAFDELKSYLSSPPLLTKAMEGEILYLYLNISDEAISSMLADSLFKFASDGSLSSKSVFVEVPDEASFMKPRMMEISIDPDTPSSTDPITSFLQDRLVPEDKQQAMRLRKKASQYTLVDGVLYKRSFSLPLLRCLNPYEAENAIREMHEGVCGSHVSARTLAHKVLRQGYYWPNMYKDATHFVQRCPKCQFFAHLTYRPTEELTNLIAPWPFAQWGLDLLGPFMKGVESVTHLIVGIVTDNDTQFNYSSFREFCSNYGIKLQFTYVYHPESNGMVTSVNKAILEGIKPRLEQHKARWVDELNNILWAYRTTRRTAIGETPYHLAFGTEAVIPIEIRVPSFKVTHFDEGENGQLFRENLDLLARLEKELDFKL
ncbi:hypothetical protein SLEP1_g42596 [Rubroshorea leprosula]|uniref:Integrase catalytic domain-containing protein n=1 Tax=Rubroshorea leprosula TaxID=152421 RepID=A0AAV5LAT7_9ROSI|nr:hypothetical protein SLEP1_g42596 [Rubroshorea leprosula]